MSTDAYRHNGQPPVPEFESPFETSCRTPRKTSRECRWNRFLSICRTNPVSLETPFCKQDRTVPPRNLRSWRRMWFWECRYFFSRVNPGKRQWFDRPSFFFANVTSARHVPYRRSSGTDISLLDFPLQINGREWQSVAFDTKYNESAHPSFRKRLVQQQGLVPSGGRVGSNFFVISSLVAKSERFDSRTASGGSTRSKSRLS